MRHSIIVLGLLAVLTVSGPARAADVTPEGKKLGAFFDAMNVEELWLPHQIVDWKTGEKLRDPKDSQPHTHCSAFAAAACKRKDVYLLRPPEHSATFLANAQFDWLHEHGRENGWAPVATGVEAQGLANKGHLVVAAYKEKDPKKHGHIALVRPSTKDETKIRDEGPQIIQAGLLNATSATLKDGFRNHPGAFTRNEIRYFVHELCWK
jgi:hypothetical protein